MIKRFHKFLCLIVVWLLGILTITACGSSKADAKSSADQLLFYMEKGDIDKAITYCSKGGQVYQTLSEFTDEGMVKSITDSFGDYPEVSEFFLDNYEYKNLFHTYKEQLYRDYSINGEQDKGDDAKIYYATVSHIDGDNIENYMVSLDECYVEYLYANYDEMNTIYENEGEAAMTVKILDGIAVKYCQLCKDQLLNNATYYDVDYKITCKKIDGEWKVTDMEKQE